MAGQNFRWKPGQSPRQVFGANTDRFVRRLKNGLILILELKAVEIEADMKENAPWEDQTGNARQTLQAFVYVVKEGLIALVAKQVMSYGLWLELKNGGRFAIVIPTLEQHYGDVWDAVREAVE